MKIIQVKDYDELSRKAAEMISHLVTKKPNAVLGLATGRTPEGTYQYLIEDHLKNNTSYQKVHTVNLDEYAGLSNDDPNSYSFYMREKLFQHIDIPIEQTHIPNGMEANLENQCIKYDSLIDLLGGVDLQILGIGRNGHIGFNEPGTSFETTTHIVELTPSTRKANSLHFKHMDQVPTHAISMGISTIMKSKQIILLINGKEKAPIFYRFLTEEMNERLPASILMKHPNVTVIADSEAFSLVKEKESQVTP